MLSSQQSRRLSSLCSKGFLLGHAVQWMVTATTLVFAALAIAFASGCSRAVLIPETSPVRAGPGMRGKVYMLVGGEWVVSDNKVDVPEGHYIVPPSFVEGPHE